VLTSKPKKGGRGFRYFVPPKVPKGAPAPARMPERVRPAKSPAVPKKRGVSSGAVAYFTPPVVEPMWAWPDTRVLAWLDEQDEAYQWTARTFAVEADVPVAEHERRRSESPCPYCGFDGTPTKAHRWNCPIGVVKSPPPRGFAKPATLPLPGGDDDETETLPF
jgi:hypothetical protein